MINNNTQNLKYAILEFERHCTDVSAGVCDCLHYLSLNAFCIIPDCFCFCFFFMSNLAGPSFHSQKQTQYMSLGNPFPPLCFKPKFDFYSSFWARCWVWGEVGRKRSKYLYSMSCVSEFRITFFFLSKKRICLLEKCSIFTLHFRLACQFFSEIRKYFL